MIERLKFCIDESEDKPNLKELFLKVASFPEDKQELALQLIDLMIQKDEGKK